MIDLSGRLRSLSFVLFLLMSGTWAMAQQRYVITHESGRFIARAGSETVERNTEVGNVVAGINTHANGAPVQIQFGACVPSATDGWGGEDENGVACNYTALDIINSSIEFSNDPLVYSKPWGEITLFGYLTSEGAASATIAVRSGVTVISEAKVEKTSVQLSNAISNSGSLTINGGEILGRVINDNNLIVSGGEIAASLTANNTTTTIQNSGALTVNGGEIKGNIENAPTASITLGGNPVIKNKILVALGKLSVDNLNTLTLNTYTIDFTNFDNIDNADGIVLVDGAAHLFGFATKFFINSYESYDFKLIAKNGDIVITKKDGTDHLIDAGFGGTSAFNGDYYATVRATYPNMTHSDGEVTFSVNLNDKTIKANINDLFFNFSGSNNPEFTLTNISKDGKLTLSFPAQDVWNEDNLKIEKTDAGFLVKISDFEAQLFAKNNATTNDAKEVYHNLVKAHCENTVNKATNPYDVNFVEYAGEALCKIRDAATRLKIAGFGGDNDNNDFWVAEGLGMFKNMEQADQTDPDRNPLDKSSLRAQVTIDVKIEGTNIKLTVKDLLVGTWSPIVVNAKIVDITNAGVLVFDNATCESGTNCAGVIALLNKTISGLEITSIDEDKISVAFGENAATNFVKSDKVKDNYADACAKVNEEVAKVAEFNDYYKNGYVSLDVEKVKNGCVQLEADEICRNDKNVWANNDCYTATDVELSDLLFLAGVPSKDNLSIIPEGTPIRYYLDGVQEPWYPVASKDVAKDENGLAIANKFVVTNAKDQITVATNFKKLVGNKTVVSFKVNDTDAKAKLDANTYNNSTNWKDAEGTYSAQYYVLLNVSGTQTAKFEILTEDSGNYNAYKFDLTVVKGNGCADDYEAEGETGLCAPKTEGVCGIQKMFWKSSTNKCESYKECAKVVDGVFTIEYNRIDNICVETAASLAIREAACVGTNSYRKFVEGVCTQNCLDGNYKRTNTTDENCRPMNAEEDCLEGSLAKEGNEYIGSICYIATDVVGNELEFLAGVNRNYILTPNEKDPWYPVVNNSFAAGKFSVELAKDQDGVGVNFAKLIGNATIKFVSANGIEHTVNGTPAPEVPNAVMHVYNDNTNWENGAAYIMINTPSATIASGKVNFVILTSEGTANKAYNVELNITKTATACSEKNGGYVAEATECVPLDATECDNRKMFWNGTSCETFKVACEDFDGTSCPVFNGISTKTTDVACPAVDGQDIEFKKADNSCVETAASLAARETACADLKKNWDNVEKVCLSTCLNTHKPDPANSTGACIIKTDEDICLDQNANLDDADENDRPNISIWVNNTIGCKTNAKITTATEACEITAGKIWDLDSFGCLEECVEDTHFPVFASNPLACETKGSVTTRKNSCDNLTFNIWNDQTKVCDQTVCQVGYKFATANATSGPCVEMDNLEKMDIPNLLEFAGERFDGTKFHQVARVQRPAGAIITYSVSLAYNQNKVAVNFGNFLTVLDREVSNTTFRVAVGTTAPATNSPALKIETVGGNWATKTAYYEIAGPAENEQAVKTYTFTSAGGGNYTFVINVDRYATNNAMLNTELTENALAFNANDILADAFESDAIPEKDYRIETTYTKELHAGKNNVVVDFTDLLDGDRDAIVRSGEDLSNVDLDDGKDVISESTKYEVAANGKIYTIYVDVDKSATTRRDDCEDLNKYYNVSYDKGNVPVAENGPYCEVKLIKNARIDDCRNGSEDEEKARLIDGNDAFGVILKNNRCVALASLPGVVATDVSFSNDINDLATAWWDNTVVSTYSAYSYAIELELGETSTEVDFTALLAKLNQGTVTVELSEKQVADGVTTWTAEREITLVNGKYTVDAGKTVKFQLKDGVNFTDPIEVEVKTTAQANRTVAIVECNGFNRNIEDEEVSNDCKVGVVNACKNGLVDTHTEGLVSGYKIGSYTVKCDAVVEPTKEGDAKCAFNKKYISNVNYCQPLTPEPVVATDVEFRGAKPANLVDATDVNCEGNWCGVDVTGFTAKLKADHNRAGVNLATVLANIDSDYLYNLADFVIRMNVNGAADEADKKIYTDIIACNPYDDQDITPKCSDITDEEAEGKEVMFVYQEGASQRTWNNNGAAAYIMVRINDEAYTDKTVEFEIKNGTKYATATVTVDASATRTYYTEKATCASNNRDIVAIGKGTDCTSCINNTTETYVDPTGVPVVANTVLTAKQTACAAVNTNCAFDKKHVSEINYCEKLPEAQITNNAVEAKGAHEDEDGWQGNLTVTQTGTTNVYTVQLGQGHDRAGVNFGNLLAGFDRETLALRAKVIPEGAVAANVPWIETFDVELSSERQENNQTMYVHADANWQSGQSAYIMIGKGGENKTAMLEIKDKDQIVAVTVIINATAAKEYAAATARCAALNKDVEVALIGDVKVDADYNCKDECIDGFTTRGTSSNSGTTELATIPQGVACIAVKLPGSCSQFTNLDYNTCDDWIDCSAEPVGMTSVGTEDNTCTKELQLVENPAVEFKGAVPTSDDWFAVESVSQDGFTVELKAEQDRVAVGFGKLGMNLLHPETRITASVNGAAAVTVTPTIPCPLDAEGNRTKPEGSNCTIPEDYEAVPLFIYNDAAWENNAAAYVMVGKGANNAAKTVVFNIQDNAKYATVTVVVKATLAKEAACKTANLVWDAEDKECTNTCVLNYSKNADGECKFDSYEKRWADQYLLTFAGMVSGSSDWYEVEKVERSEETKTILGYDVYDVYLAYNQRSVAVNFANFFAKLNLSAERTITARIDGGLPISITEVDHDNTQGAAVPMYVYEDLSGADKFWGNSKGADAAYRAEEAYIIVGKGEGNALKSVEFTVRDAGVDHKITVRIFANAATGLAANAQDNDLEFVGAATTEMQATDALTAVRAGNTFTVELADAQNVAGIKFANLYSRLNNANDIAVRYHNGASWSDIDDLDAFFNGFFAVSKNANNADKTVMFEIAGDDKVFNITVVVKASEAKCKAEIAAAGENNNKMWDGLSCRYFVESDCDKDAGEEYFEGRKVCEVKKVCDDSSMPHLTADNTCVDDREADCLANPAKFEVTIPFWNKSLEKCEEKLTVCANVNWTLNALTNRCSDLRGGEQKCLQDGYVEEGEEAVAGFWNSANAVCEPKIFGCEDPKLTFISASNSCIDLRSDATRCADENKFWDVTKPTGEKCVEFVNCADGWILAPTTNTCSDNRSDSEKCEAENKYYTGTACVAKVASCDNDYERVVNNVCTDTRLPAQKCAAEGGFWTGVTCATVPTCTAPYVLNATTNTCVDSRTPEEACVADGKYWNAAATGDKCVAKVTCSYAYEVVVNNVCVDQRDEDVKCEAAGKYWNDAATGDKCVTKVTSCSNAYEVVENNVCVDKRTAAQKCAEFWNGTACVPVVTTCPNAYESVVNNVCTDLRSEQQKCATFWNATASTCDAWKTCTDIQVLNTVTNTCVSGPIQTPNCEANETLVNNVCVAKTEAEIAAEACVAAKGTGARLVETDGEEVCMSVAEQVIAPIVKGASVTSNLGFTLNGSSMKILGLTKAETVRIVDLKGKVMMTKTVMPNESVSISNLPKGMYLVNVNGKTFRMVK